MEDNQPQTVRPCNGSLGVMGFSFDQFSDILKVRNAAGRPYLLIGGQAVNYWAERYSVVEPGIKTFRPFTSEDIDFRGTIDDVRSIARQLALKPFFPPKVAMTMLAGVIPVQIAGQPSNIEVVRQVPGVSSTVEDLAIEAKWEDKMIRVLDPISLLASKLELVSTAPQTQRNDVTHLRILAPCVRAFLDDLLQEVEHKQIPARSWLTAANHTLKLTTNLRARKIGNKYRINWDETLPLNAITKSQDEKIKRIRELQMERSHKKTK